MNDHHLGLWQQLEEIVNSFVREGSLEVEAVQERRQSRVDHSEDLKWVFNLPCGSFVATLTSILCNGKPKPAIAFEVAIAEVVVGSRSAAMKWAMQRNTGLGGGLRLGLNKSYVVVGFALVIDFEHEVSFVKNTLFSLPDTAQRLLADMGSAVVIRPFFGKIEQPKAALQ